MRLARVFALLLLPFVLALAPAHSEDRPLTVFAAASLKDALDDVAASYVKDKPLVTVSYAGSSALAKQIENAAPADLFISADLDWMDYLQKKSLIKADSVTQLLGNDLVLIAPADSNMTFTLAPGVDLVQALGGGKLAMADVSAVPAGKYGKEALLALGVWNAVAPQVVQAENVRAALKLVALKEAALGVVYGSDAKAEKAVKFISVFPDNSHKPIIYPAGIIAASTHPDAQAFLDFLKSSTARDIFADHGFKPLVP